MADDDTSTRRTPDPDEQAALRPEPLDPEPLEMDAEDIPKAFPHGENPHPPSESDAQVPG